jgi:hypothetical protein
MKGFYWGSGVVRCGFCGHTGHNITTCKSVDQYADLALDKFAKIPDYVPNSHEHRALVELKRREERKVKTRKPRKPPACSYCGSLHHKRPKCRHLKQFKQDLYAANKAWKKVNIKCFANIIGDSLLTSNYWFLDYIEPVVVSPAPFDPDQDWLDGEWDEIFNWFFNEINVNIIERKKLSNLVEKWIDQ